ncbi:MAG TPA: CDGSH iron-sulfur domain-containing protein [Candidatus Binatia bacterium]|nr:CDGSH iron-sulfur domain-containing protein [Candidatus Binatia bacterium]
MSEPPIARREPFLLELPAGDYLWCACGRSRTQPFCDGSHAGTGVEPLKFSIQPRRNPQTVWLCGCKRSRRPPFCDGTHNKLPTGT